MTTFITINAIIAVAAAIITFGVTLLNAHLDIKAAAQSAPSIGIAPTARRTRCRRAIALRRANRAHKVQRATRKGRATGHTAAAIDIAQPKAPRTRRSIITARRTRRTAAPVDTSAIDRIATALGVSPQVAYLFT